MQHFNVNPRSRGTQTELFQPLNPENHEIRLVTLEPAPDAHTQPVCTQHVAVLDQNPEFEALSWVWGDPTRTQEIILNDRVWNAPETLITALRYIRFVDNVRVLWIDALCINQGVDRNALLERSQQIQLMKYIYRRSLQVVVWIGPPSSISENFLSTYAHYDYDLWAARVSFSDGPTMTKGLLDLFEKPWWRRLWILQEAALPRKVSLLYNSKKGLSLRVFLKHVDDIFPLIQSDTKTPEQRALAEMVQKILGTFRPLADNAAEAAASDKRHSSTQDKISRFTKVISRYRYHEATDPRDKIYGLLSFADDEIVSLLAPIYDEPVETTFIRTTKILICQPPSPYSTSPLFLLGQALPQSRSARFSHLPTWVPDWTISSQHHDQWSIVSAQSAHDFGFRASMGVPNATDVIDGSILKVRGILVDVVRIVSPPMSSALNWEEWLSGSKSWRETLCLHLAQASSAPGLLSESPDHIVDILTNICDLVPATVPDITNTFQPHQNERNFPYGSRIHPANYTWPYRATFLHGLLPVASTTTHRYMNQPYVSFPKLVLEGLTRCKTRIVPFLDHLESDAPPLRPEYDGHVLKHIRRATAGRSLFITEDGFIGNGLRAMKPGDLIFVLAGANLPIVLRPVPSRPQHYVLVGESYVHDVMDGEAITQPWGSFRRRRTDEEAEGLKSDVGADTIDEEDPHQIWEDIYIV